jgi:hypothetical protein
MSKMLAEIGRIVDDVSIRVSQYDILFESITNAIHAKANNIICKFNTIDNPIQEDGKELALRKVDSISIIDDGVGLDEANYNSFCNYRTEYKKEYGCKGVGRFVFLKVYKKVKFVSQLVNEQVERSFDFDLNFDTSNLEIKKKKIDVNKTELTFSTLTPLYLNSERYLDRRIGMNLSTIREKVLLNLLPTLYFNKKKGVHTKIVFVDETTSDNLSITSDDIPNFDEKEFDIKDRDGKIITFVLSHKIDKVAGSLSAYYCANNRTVCEFSDKDLKITLPFEYSGYLLLESNYFNTRVNNERNNFDIFPFKTDMFNTLSWDMINASVKSLISDIVKNEIPETKDINIAKLEKIHNVRPYLVSYIDDEDIDIAGFFRRKTYN